AVFALDLDVRLGKPAQTRFLPEPAKNAAENELLPRLQRDELAFSCPAPFGMGHKLDKDTDLLSGVLVEPVPKGPGLLPLEVVQMTPASLPDLLADIDSASHHVPGVLVRCVDVRVTGHLISSLVAHQVFERVCGVFGSGHCKVRATSRIQTQ